MKGYSPSDQPRDVAKELLASTYTEHGMRTIAYHREDWYRWRGQHWARATAEDLRDELYGPLGDEEGWKPNKRKLDNVLDAMRGLVRIPDDVNAPVWLPDQQGGEHLPATDRIAVRNGILDWTTRTLEDHTPRLFNLDSRPFDYQPDAPHVVWDQFLADLFGPTWRRRDQESLDLLQEWFGYVVSPCMDQHKALLMIGPKRAGKGTIMRAVEQLVGGENTMGAQLRHFGQRFTLSGMVGKSLVTMGDVRSSARGEQEATEVLLGIIGEDDQMVDRKHREPIKVRFSCRIMAASNSIPHFVDPSGVVVSRWAVLRLTESFFGKEDKTLGDRIAREMPGILNWALDGLDRLTRNGRFTEPESGADTKATMSAMASQLYAFAEDRLNVTGDETDEIVFDDFYDSYRVWATNSGQQEMGKAKARGQLSEGIEVEGQTMRAVRPRRQGRRDWLVQGACMARAIRAVDRFGA